MSHPYHDLSVNCHSDIPTTKTTCVFPIRFSTSDSGCFFSGVFIALFLAVLPIPALAQSSQLVSSQEKTPLDVSSRTLPIINSLIGEWKINHSLSQSPSPVFNKTEVSLLVTHDEKHLRVEQKLRLNGHAQPSQPLQYPLMQAFYEMPVARPVAGKAKLSMRWLAKEGRLELRCVIETPLFNEKGEKTEDARLVTLEYWELMEQGKLLKVVRVKEWPDRAESSRLIFERQ